jgi:colicin import membrane protein
MKIVSQIAALVFFATASVANAASASTPANYALALERAILGNWSAPTEIGPDVVCRVNIRQHPGGDIVDAKVIGECAANEKLSDSIELAILRANPLPYFGFEAQFQKDLVVDLTIGKPRGFLTSSAYR